MDISLPKNLKLTHKTYLQRAGYHEFSDPNTGKISYIRRYSRDFYPRLHVYLEERQENVILSLHLDQKKPSYGGGTHAHGGEYNGAVVEREIARLRDFINKMEEEYGQPEEEKKGFLRKIFGG